MRRRGGQPRPAPMQGRPPMARLRPGPACMGGQQRSQGAAATRSGSSPQGRCLRAEAPPVGTTTCSATPSRGAGYRTPARGCQKQGRWRRAQWWLPLGRAAAG
ncbi:hypothetical protein BHM03_00034725 [Ensete ventricosum]|nr:hypothetical protein BHM03_00034725 [Ensete ventricosum]